MPGSEFKGDLCKADPTTYKHTESAKALKRQGCQMAEVTIYTRQLCGFCVAAKRLLESKKVKYKEHDATFDPALKKEMVQKANGRSTFPQIFVGDTHVGGCDELHALDRAGKLDPLLSA